MESAGASGVDGVPDPESVTLRAAAELRFDRPDLTAALARHLTEVAAAAADRDGWLRASGWLVHAASAIGDGREAAAEALEALPWWGADAMDTAAADRLRESSGKVETAREGLMSAVEGANNVRATAVFGASTVDGKDMQAAARDRVVLSKKALATAEAGANAAACWRPRRRGSATAPSCLSRSLIVRPPS